MSSNQPISLLHFADAHIDMITHGRRAESGLPDDDKYVFVKITTFC